MRLPGPWNSKYQGVLSTIHERALQQRAGLLEHLRRQTLQLQGLPALFRRQPRLAQQTLDPVVPPLLTLPLHQAQQVLLVAQPLLLGLSRQLLVAVPARRQVQFLQTLHQPVLHVLFHPPPPSLKAGRHTTPDPLAPSPPPSAT